MKSKATIQRLLLSNLSSIAGRVPLHWLKAIDQLTRCRTSVLGGHAQYCENGHLTGVWYNSCRHRFCPQCRALPTERWLKSTEAILLDSAHHHVIFTMPSELHALWRYNKALLNDLLFKTAQETLKTFARDARYLNAMPGILCVLHTWGRSLSIHPHIHAVISHGGLNQQGEWIIPKKDSLFPQKPVMMVFRGKLLALMKTALEKGELKFPAQTQKSDVSNLLNKLGRRAWVVHFCRRYEHARGVVKYLSRYVKSGPFKNTQLVSADRGQVCFRYFDHQSKQTKWLKLGEQQFIRRLLEHVPEPGKPMVRYSGLYNSAARSKLNLAREALGQKELEASEVLDWQEYLADKGIELRCDCGARIGKRVLVQAQKMKT